ncbi:MAG: isochorismatase family protein [Bauldia sp.]
MTVIDLRFYSDPTFVPLVILVDPQREYLAEGRALRLAEAERVAANCRELLRFAREHGFPVAVTRWRQRGKFLADTSGFGGWIEGLEPHGSDMVFEKAMPSCYSNQSFAEMMAAGGGDHAVIAGFTGSLACLSTMVDGYHRGHKLTFLSDASASHPLDGCGAGESDAVVASVVSLYARVSTLSGWMNEQVRALERPRAVRA